jgi:hypothetical protein
MHGGLFCWLAGSAAKNIYEKTEAVIFIYLVKDM